MRRLITVVLLCSGCASSTVGQKIDKPAMTLPIDVPKTTYVKGCASGYAYGLVYFGDSGDISMSQFYFQSFAVCVSNELVAQMKAAERK